MRVNSTRQPFSTRASPRAAAEMAFSAAGRAEQQDVGALLEPDIAGGERHDLGLADHRHGLEVEGGEGFAGGQSRFGQVAFDAAAAAVGDLVLGQRGQEASGRPAFLVGLRGELGPHQFDAGRRSSESSSSTRAASTVMVVVMPRLAVGVRCHDVDCRQLVVERRAAPARRRSPGSASVRAGSAFAAAARSGNRPASRSASIRLGEFGFAGALMGERQQADHDRAGPPFLTFGAQRLEGAGIGRTREQLIAIDQIEQRHRLLAQAHG